MTYPFFLYDKKALAVKLVFGKLSQDLSYFLREMCYSISASLKYLECGFKCEIRHGVNEMKSESVIIHKGGKEDKYKIYVEDYVISYLKYETGTLELSEIFFYGYCERNAKEYVIYGAGRDKQLVVFNKYDLLERITCRLTQGGPVFMVRENGDLYEVKGYDVFYHNNEEMQSYLIDRKQQCPEADKTDDHVPKYISANVKMKDSAEAPRKHMHNAVSMQLGVIFVILIAIVINSTNSYDKMERLNQSAQEVFFAIENQEAEEVTAADGVQGEITVERDISWENTEKEIQEAILQSVADENKAERIENKPQQDEEENEPEGILKATEDEAEDGIVENEVRQDDTESEEDTLQDAEALSRSITRYYEIERGDTLYTISEKIYGDTSKVQEICELNQISDPDNIRYGQKIILP